MTEKQFSISLDKVASKEALEFIRKFPEKMKEVNEISLFRIGAEVRSMGGRLAPFKTGNLRRSLTAVNSDSIFEEKKNQVVVGTKLVYARAQEYGYKRIPAKRYMTKAMDKQKSGRGEEIFRQELKTISK